MRNIQALADFAAIPSDAAKRAIITPPGLPLRITLSSKCEVACSLLLFASLPDSYIMAFTILGRENKLSVLKGKLLLRQLFISIRLCRTQKSHHPNNK